MDKEQLIKSLSTTLSDFLDTHFGGTKKETLIPIIKKFEDEKMEVVEVLYCLPDEADLHNEGMNEKEIRKMVNNFNDNIDKISGNIAHAVNTTAFKPIKAWVNECECMIGEEVVPEGMPLVKVKFFDKEMWNKRKDGTLQGVSMGARGITVEGDKE